MKARRVFITLEVTTKASLKALKSGIQWESSMWYGLDGEAEVHQVSVNVAKNVAATAIITQNKKRKCRKAKK